MKELMVTDEGIRHAKLQSDRHHQQTNTQLFYMPDALPAAQPVGALKGNGRYCLNWSNSGIIDELNKTKSSNYNITVVQ